MIRTCDFYVPNVALYQAELHPVGAAYLNGLSRPWQQVGHEFFIVGFPPCLGAAAARAGAPFC